LVDILEESIGDSDIDTDSKLNWKIMTLL